MTEQSKERKARACLVLGVLLEDEGEFKCAARMYRQAIALKPAAVAPHVRLGFLCWRDGQDVAGMYESFSTAVRLDPQAVRQALPRKGEPEEARLISLVLYPKQHRQRRRPAQTQGMAPTISAYLERLARGEAELAAGRDTEAVEVIEALLREDPEDPYPVPLLVLAYLLRRAVGETGDSATGQGSMLRQVHPELARLLFQRGSS
jgi:Flp pilus assembly protein TadD